MYTELNKLLKKKIIQLSAALIIILSVLQCLYIVRSDRYRACSNDMIRLNEDYMSGALTENYDINSYLVYMESDAFYIADVIEEKVTFAGNAASSENSIRQKLSSSLFSSEDDQRKLKRDLKYIQYNRGIQVTFTNDLLLTSYFTMDPLYLILIFLASLVSSLYLFISDYESGLKNFIKQQEKNRLIFALTKSLPLLY